MNAEPDRLVAALRHKLAELDAEVVAYRRERADEFRRYAADLLQPAAATVAADVAAAIDSPDAHAGLAEAYAALYLGLVDHAAADTAGGSPFSILSSPHPPRAGQPRRVASPPPILYHTSGMPKDGPRKPPPPSPAIRHNDFRGVFTPTFLPLLDGVSSNNPQPSSGGPGPSLLSAAAASRQGEPHPSEKAEVDAQATAAVTTEAPVPTPTPPPAAPPALKLKSALRRSSSASLRSAMSMRSARASPVTIQPAEAPALSSRSRQVRFSFGGEEVLPTSSPPQSATGHDLPWLLRGSGYHGSHGDEADANDEPSSSSAMAAAGFTAEDEQLSPRESMLLSGAAEAGGDALPHLQASDLPLGSEAPDQGASSAEQLLPRRHGSLILDDGDTESDREDETDFIPLSRRISSSDRLRALSKLPLEDPTNWTVVNPQASDAADPDDGSPPEPVPSVAEIISNHNSLGLVEPVEQPPSPPPPADNEADRDSDSSSGSDDDEGFIAMRPARKNSLGAPVPASSEVPATGAAVSTANTNGTGVATAAAPKATPKATAEGGDQPEMSINGVTRPAKGTYVHYADDNRPAAPAATNGNRYDDEDFFGFEDEAGNGAVGYPLARVPASSAGPHFSDEDVDDDDDDEDDLDDVGEDVVADNVRVAELACTNDDGLVDDDVLVQKEKQALGIGTDGFDSDKLVFNHRLPLSQAGGANAAASAAGPEGSAAAGANRDIAAAASPPALQPMSVGSYRGRPLSAFNVVKDPRVLQEAAALGELDSFVGSVHDAPDPLLSGDYSSLRGRDPHGLLSGTPRSLTERMAMDNARAFLSSSAAKHR